MQPKKFRKILISGRAAVGWSAILMPKLVARAWGVGTFPDRGVRYTIRLFGIRNALMSYQLYQAERSDADPEEVEEVLRQGIVVDVFDVLFGCLFFLVIILTGYHSFLGNCLNKFKINENNYSSKFFRIFNEVPTILLILIVFIVILKPI